MLPRSSFRQAITASAGCGDSTILLFLYQTRTISTAYIHRVPTTVSDHGAPNSAWSGAISEPAMTSRRNVVRGNSAVARSGRQHQRYDSTVQEGEDTLRSKSLGSKSRAYERGPRPAYVPFEGLPKRPDPNADLEGSTITPSERKAFESLLAAGSNKRSGKSKASAPGQSVIPGQENEDREEPPHERRAARLDALLESALAPSDSAIRPSPKLPHALRSTVAAARDRLAGRVTNDRRALKDSPLMKVSSPLSTAFEVVRDDPFREALRSEIAQVKTMMEQAETDVKVWEILREKAIDVLEAMGLDRNKKEDRTEEDQKRHRSDPKDVAKDIPNEDVSWRKPQPPADPVGYDQSHTNDATNLPVPSDQSTAVPGNDSSVLTASNIPQSSLDPEYLAKSIPVHIENAQRTLRIYFPSSALRLSVVPTIRALGPAASAFALASRHYHAHLACLWSQYQDPHAVLGFLQEMEDNVMKFTSSTNNIIRPVLEFARSASAGGYGPSVQMLWGTEGKMEAVRALLAWQRLIARRVEEEALRKARENEALDGLRDEEQLARVVPRH